MAVLILDNYDSFTFNLFQYIAELGGSPLVYKNDEMTLDQIRDLNPSHIIISPGPGRPTKKKDFGVCSSVIKNMYQEVPIFGVCLGCQGIATTFGSKIIEASEIIHGSRSKVRLNNNSMLFKGINPEIEVMRYHSLVIDDDTLSDEFHVIARSIPSNYIMAIEHKEFPLYGVQFHPESIGTPSGMEILKNFLGCRVHE